MCDYLSFLAKKIILLKKPPQVDLAHFIKKI